MGYVTIADVRAQGLTDTAKYPDATVQAAIDLSSQYIDRTTRQWFESRALTVLMDGQDSARLFLPVPVITVTELYVNNRFAASEVLPATDYVVYNGRALPDDRKNPKIQLITARQSIYQVPNLTAGGRTFMKGPRNQKIVGTWGYTESDGTTPLLIKRACMKMTLRFADKLAEGGSGTGGTSGSSGAIIGESTDGHFIQYAMPSAIGVSGGTYGISKDPEVEIILQMFRAPLALAVPGSSQFELG